MENAEAVGGQRRQVSTSPLISPVTLVHAGHSSQAGQSVKVIAPTTPAVPASTHTADISLRESLLLALYKTTRLPLPRSARSLALPTDAPGFCPPPDPDRGFTTFRMIRSLGSIGRTVQGPRESIDDHHQWSVGRPGAPAPVGHLTPVGPIATDEEVDDSEVWGDGGARRRLRRL